MKTKEQEYNGCIHQGILTNGLTFCHDGYNIDDCANCIFQEFYEPMHGPGWEVKFSLTPELKTTK